MTDATLAGRVFSVEKKNGVSNNGNSWTITNFNLTRVKQRKNQQTGQFENYEETIPLSGFGDFNLIEKGVYQIGVDFTVRQSQNGGTYASQTVKWVEPILVPHNQQNQPTQNYQSQPQQNYQQNNGGFDGDDIPF